MTATDDVELDLLEQCRSGDRNALRALVAFWGGPALRLAATLTGDDGRARDALAEAFIDCWRALPSGHSDTPFRPYLLDLVARAALARGSAGGTATLDRCLDMLEPDARATARRRNAPARVPYRRTRPYRRPAPLARRVDRHHRRAALSARVDDPLTDRSIARPDRVPMVDRDHRRTRGLRAASSASRRRIPSRVVAAAAA